MVLIQSSHQRALHCTWTQARKILRLLMSASHLNDSSIFLKPAGADSGTEGGTKQSCSCLLTGASSQLRTPREGNEQQNRSESERCMMLSQKNTQRQATQQGERTAIEQFD